MEHTPINTMGRDLMSQVVFLCGTGGVGKTTTSVAMAMHKARLGKRCVLLTIDPAQRLADALHLPMKKNVLKNIPLPIENGTLQAMMLDAPTSFEQFTKLHATPSEWNRLQDNRYFQFASQKMGGIQEMMAVIEMINLVDSGTVDCVIVDTPPAQNAQQFFEAPEKIQHLFSQSGLHWLTSKESGFAAFSIAKNIVSKGLQFFLGAETIVEIGDFFTLFKSVAEALEKRSQRCQEVLHSQNTEYWLVEVPHYRLGQLDQLEKYLLEHDLTIQGSIQNRSLPKLDAIPNETMKQLKSNDPLLADVLLDIEHRHSNLYCEKGTVQLPQTMTAQLDSINGLWEWSLGLAPYSEDGSPNINTPSEI